MKPLACSLFALATLALCGRLTLAEKLPIRHTTPKGEKFSGDVYDWPLSGPVAALKDKLIGEYGVARDTLHVIWKGDELGDDFELSNCQGATFGLELHLRLDFHQIKVLKLDGSVVHLAGEQGDTIASLKDKLARRERIAPCQLCLMREGERVSDGKRLEEYVAASGEFLSFNLVLIPGQVRVRLPSGELITFDLGSHEQVASLKSRIQVEKNIVRERQGLYMNGRELSDEQFLTACPSSSERPQTLTLIEREPIQELQLQLVHVRLASNRLVTFEVASTDLVASLKRKISEAEGVALHRQHLYAAFQELADNMQLNDCLPSGVREPIVELRVCPSSGTDGQGAWHVHLKSERDLEEIFEIAPDDTVASLKSRIRAHRNMPQDQQLKLLFEREELAEDTQMVEHVRDNGSQLNLIAPRSDGPEVVHIKLPSGRLVTYEISPSSSVETLKEYIKSERGFLIHKQRLFSGDRELANNRRLSEYNIVSGSTLILLLVPDAQQGCTVS